MKLAKLTITTQDSPVIGKIVQGALTLPKVLVFRDGEAMDFVGDPADKASIVEVMLREVSRDSVQTLKTVKMAERFLHLDSWAAQHPDEDGRQHSVRAAPPRQRGHRQEVGWHAGESRQRASDSGLPRAPYPDDDQIQLGFFGVNRLHRCSSSCGRGTPDQHPPGRIRRGHGHRKRCPPP